jgi:hypothetical protein
LTVRRFSRETFQLMAKEFFGVELSEDQVSRLMERLETWLRDLEAGGGEPLEHEEPITVVYVEGEDDAGQRG